jgi:hypothetical protein
VRFLETQTTEKQQTGWDDRRFVVGVDLGQSRDFTAIAVAEARLELVGEDGLPAGPPPLHRARFKVDTLIEVRHLERVKGVDYPEITQRILELVRRPELQAQQSYLVHESDAFLPPSRRTRIEKPDVCIDATGVGRPICDYLREQGLKFDAVQLTASGRPRMGGLYWNVPKRDLIGQMQVAAEAGWLYCTADSPLAETFVKELRNFRIKVNISTAHDSYEAWREGDHDDLVLAVGMAVWAAIAKPRRSPLVGGR